MTDTKPDLSDITAQLRIAGMAEEAMYSKGAGDLYFGSANEIDRLRAEVERQGGVIADMAANGVDDVAGDALDDRDDAIEALQARATAAEAERDAALERERAMRVALDVAYDLSTYAACINWRARDKDNTGEWLDELKEMIVKTQGLIEAIREPAALTSAPAQPSLPERFEAAVSKAEAATAQQGAEANDLIVAANKSAAEAWRFAEEVSNELARHNGLLAALADEVKDPGTDVRVAIMCGKALVRRAAGLTEGAENG